MKSNEELYKDVVEKLTFDHWLHANNVIVGVKDGVVTLTGTVDTYNDIWAIEEAVKTVRGVKAIVNELKVKLPDSHKRSDAEIAQAIVNAWKWNVLVPEEDVKAVVEDGIVTLTGEVKWNFQREEAEQSIRRLMGIKSIINLIKVKKQIISTDVKQKILEEFKRNAEIDAKNIQVEVRDDVVELRGEVHSWEEVKQAVRAAWSIPGVASVKNELRVAY